MLPAVAVRRAPAAGTAGALARRRDRASTVRRWWCWASTWAAPLDRARARRARRARRPGRRTRAGRIRFRCATSSCVGQEEIALDLGDAADRDRVRDAARRRRTCSSTAPAARARERRRSSDVRRLPRRPRVAAFGDEDRPGYGLACRGARWMGGAPRPAAARARRRWPIRSRGCSAALTAVDVLARRARPAHGRVSLEGAVGHLLGGSAPVADDRLRVERGDGVTEIVFDHPPINIYDVATRDALCEVLTGGDRRSRRAGRRCSRPPAITSPPAPTSRSSAPRRRCSRCATRAGAATCGACLRAVPVPMVASMHGNAVGFGFELALQCDYRLAADDCVVALPEARVGHAPGRRREPDAAAGRGHERGAGDGP